MRRGYFGHDLSQRLEAFLFAYTLGNSKGIRQYHVRPFTCAFDKELMLFNVQNGTTVYTHIALVHKLLRMLTNIYYLSHKTWRVDMAASTNTDGVDFPQHNDHHYAIAGTPLSGGGGGV